MHLWISHTLIENTSILPRLSDHDIIMAEVNVKPKMLKQVPRNIPLNNKVQVGKGQEKVQSEKDSHSKN